MPLEGHYRRVNTPLRKLTVREMRVLVIGGLLTLVACLALIFLPSSSGGGAIIQDKAGRSCVEVFVAGRVGSEPVVGCGSEAVAICRRASQFDDPRAHTIVDACRAEGIEY